MPVRQGRNRPREDAAPDGAGEIIFRRFATKMPRLRRSRLIARGAAIGAFRVLHGRPLHIAHCLGRPSLISNHHRLAFLQLDAESKLASV